MEAVIFSGKEATSAWWAHVSDGHQSSYRYQRGVDNICK